MRYPSTGIVLLAVLAGHVSPSAAEEPQTAYFADGYRGGVYGHYPPGYTGFLVEQLQANPDWKINLEIEPETRDVALASEPEAYAALKALLADQSDAGRIEFVNPTYAQSYLYQSSGESVIRQFDYGIRKLLEHFPNVVLTTYSSEEPCFTSCLPPVLQRIAQQSRAAEHRLLVAEKLAAMAFVEAGRPSNADALDEAWHNVLLSQRHDCWIVPYNGRVGNTWADQVRLWTNLANAVSDVAVNRSVDALLEGEGRRRRRFVRLFNPTASAVDTVVPVPMPATDEPSRAVSLDADGRRFATQVATSDAPGQCVLLVRAGLPPLGYATVELRDDAEATEPPVTATATGSSCSSSFRPAWTTNRWRRTPRSTSARAALSTRSTTLGKTSNTMSSSTGSTWRAARANMTSRSSPITRRATRTARTSRWA